MIRNDVNIFNIESIADYLDFCRLTVAELAKDQANVVRGFSAVLSLNHIPDWLQYKLSSSQRSMLGLSDVVGNPVKNHFEAMYNDLALIRSVANGFKHLRPMHSTKSLNLLHFRGQGKKSYLPSKGDMRHDKERQHEPQEVQQRVQD